MFGLKLIRDTMAQDLNDPLGSGSTGGGTSGIPLDELQRFAYYFDMSPDDVAALDPKELTVLRRVMRNAETTGKDPRQIKEYQDLIDGGLITPSDLRKLLFGDSSGGDGVGWANLALAKEKFEYDKQQDAQKTVEDRRQFDQTYARDIRHDAEQLGLDYDRLNQQEKSDLRNLAYQYYNSTNDANASRMQALASLIQSRTNGANDLARTSADIAKTGAEFAAHPRDAYADILYQKAVGGPAPYGQTSGPNADAFAEYGTALDQRFQDMFGGVAGDISRVRGYLDQPIPSEYTTPIRAPQFDAQPQQYGPPQQLGAPPAGGQFYGFNSPEEAQAMMQYFQKQGQLPGNAGGGSAMAKSDAKQPMGGMMRADPGKQMMETHHITKTHPDGKRETHVINKSKPWEPKDSAPPQLMDIRGEMGGLRSNARGGTQVLPEPTVLMGVSGKIYGTASENGQEQVTETGDGFQFDPLPGVPQQLDPRRQQEIINAVPGHAKGGMFAGLGRYTAPRRVSGGGSGGGGGGAANDYYGFGSNEAAIAYANAMRPQGDLGSNIYNGVATPQDPNGPGGDPRYSPSQGTFNGPAGVVPLGNGSIISGQPGQLGGVANPDSTFQNQYSYLEPWTNPYTGVQENRTVTRPVSVGDRQRLRDETAQYYIGRSTGGKYAQWLGQMADYGTNLANFPRDRAWEEFTTPSGARATAPYGSRTQNMTPTGRYIVGYDGDTPIYGERDAQGNFQTPRSIAASGGRGGGGAPPQLSARRNATGSTNSGGGGGGGGGGGSAGTGATPAKLTSELSQRLAAIDPQLVLQPGQTLPDPRLLTSPALLRQLEADQDLYDLMVSAYSHQGISEAKLKAILKQMGFTGPKNFQPSVRVA